VYGGTQIGAAFSGSVIRVNDDDAAVDPDVVLRIRIAQLRQEHQDLDAAVHALARGARPDMIQIARLKKKKLALRDQLTEMEDQMTPDIIA
jgi:hypothetical protein